MANLELTQSDLPTTDKDGATIDLNNPLKLEDILVRLVDVADPIRGSVGSQLSNPADGPVNWAMRGLFLRDILLDQSITALAAELASLAQQLLTLSGRALPQASTTQAGIAEFGNLNEIRSGTNESHMVNAYSLLDFLRNGTGAGATTARKGTVEFATFIEAQQGDATNLALSVAASLSQLRAPISQAKETQRGTAFRATKAQAEAGTDDDAMMTALKVDNHFDKRIWIGTQAEFNAITTKDNSTLYFVT